MKVILLNPFNSYYSHSIHLLKQAKVLKSNRMDVQVIFSNLLFSDDNFSLPLCVNDNPGLYFDKIKEVIERENADLLYIFTIDSNSSHLLFAKKMIELVSIPVVIGGFLPTFMPEKVLELLPDAKAVIIGDDEQALLDFIQAYKDNTPLENISNIAFLKNNKYTVTKMSKVKHEPDDLPLIDYDEVIGNPPNRVEINFSKGCLMKCGFCGLNSFFQSGLRRNSIEYVIRQIRHLIKKYPCNYLHFDDLMFLSNPSFAVKLGQSLHNEFPGLKWGAMIRNEYVKKDPIKILAECGMINACIGIESNNPRVLEFLNKTNNIDYYIKNTANVLKILKAYMKILEIGLITATPVEDERDIIDLIAFIKSIKNRGNLGTLRIALGKLNVYPGTLMWKKYEQGEFALFFNGSFNKYEKYIAGDLLPDPWLMPDKYMIENQNITDKTQYIRLLKVAFDTANNHMSDFK